MLPGHRRAARHRGPGRLPMLPGHHRPAGHRSEWPGGRCAENSPDALPRNQPSGRAIGRLLNSKRERLSATDARIIAVVKEAVPAPRQAAKLVECFQAMLRTKKKAALDAWLEDATGSLLAAFAKGIAADRDAVMAAITAPWSNG